MAPSHLEYGVKQAFEISAERYERIIIAGMGGSAISGMILRDLLPVYSPVHVEVVSKETLPPHGENTLLIAISYSGKTGETLSMIESYEGKRIIGISSVDDFVEETYNVPSGLPPRYAFYYIFSLLIRIVSEIYDVSELLENLKSTASVLRSSVKNMISEGGPIEVSLSAFNGKIPLIYTPAALAGVGYRWKTQFNENSKQHAFSHSFPEMSHNEIVPYIAKNEGLLPILLRSSREGRIENKQMDYFSGLALLEYEFEAANALEEMMKFILLGDLLSYGLSEQNVTDPLSIDMIDRLKEIL